MKTKIIKFFLTKDNFFDRERLLRINYFTSFQFVADCFRDLKIKLYCKFLKTLFIKKIEVKAEISPLEQISNCYSQIGYKSKFKAFFRKKRGFRNHYLITNVLTYQIK